MFYGKHQKYTSNWLGHYKKRRDSPVSDLLELIFLRKWMGQESLAGYSPWLKKSSDMTEHAIND